jgi:hypothetical protein
MPDGFMKALNPDTGPLREYSSPCQVIRRQMVDRRFCHEMGCLLRLHNATKTTTGTETGKVIFTMISQEDRKERYLLLCRCY